MEAKAEHGDSRGATPPRPEDAIALARQAVVATLVLYVAYGLLRLVLPPGFAEYLGLALIAGARRQIFVQAVAKDPESVRALSGVSLTNSFIAIMHWTPDREAAMRRLLRTGNRRIL